MDTIYYIFAGLLGLIIGSFLNVVVLRLHTKKISRGRSKCGKCGATLQSRDLIPIFSYLFLRGRCRHCGLKISAQYICVEIVTTIVFVLVAVRAISMAGGAPVFAGIFFAYYVFIFSLIIAMCVYDVRHMVLPWTLMRIFLIISFVGAIASQIFWQEFSVFTLLSGVIVALPFFLLWKFSNGRLIGFGDVEFMCGIGYLLGISQGGSAILLGFWLGALFVFLKFIILGKKIVGSDALPLGPFLALGTLFIFLSSISFFDIAMHMLGA